MPVNAIFSLTSDLVIDSWNPGAERLLGYTSADVLGQPIDVVVPDHVRGELDAALELLLTR
jgi:PAS domain S-box-containing protein